MLYSSLALNSFLAVSTLALPHNELHSDLSLSTGSFETPNMPTSDLQPRTDTSSYFEGAGDKDQVVSELIDNVIKLLPCDVSNISQPPASPTPLPAPTGHLSLITIGRGTQNYTCGDNSTAPPKPKGAVATLYNLNKVAASSNNEILRVLNVGLLGLFQNDTFFETLPVAGQHFFSDDTTAVFDLTPADLDVNSYKRDTAVPAPASAGKAIPWLLLKATPESKGKAPINFRLETAGGAAPATCGDIRGDFTFDYAAEYWFYEV